MSARRRSRLRFYHLHLVASARDSTAGVALGGAGSSSSESKEDMKEDPSEEKKDAGEEKHGEGGASSSSGPPQYVPPFEKGEFVAEDDGILHI